MAAPATKPLEATTVVVFAKEPVAGQVKTRLASDLGEERAAGLYRCFLADLAGMLGGLPAELDRPVSLVLAYAGDREHAGFDPFREADFEFIEQASAGLGQRLSRVSEACFERGTQKLLIIGTDSPTLSAGHFERALDALSRHDVALGPSFDGGYYLIGLNGPHVEVFENIDWSTGQVFAQTMRRCRASSLLCATLEFWYDVDTFDDLKLLKSHLFDDLRYRTPDIGHETAEYIVRLDAQGVFAEQTE